jgi:hypothetical protein
LSKFSARHSKQLIFALVLGQKAHALACLAHDFNLGRATASIFHEVAAKNQRFGVDEENFRQVLSNL